VIINFDGTTESVRLIGIDTPEPEGGYRPPECYGDEASEFTRQLLPEGTTVLVTRDVEPRDVYDRLLGYLYRAEDNLFVNLAIVESGFADTLNIAPNDTYAGDFMAAAAAARSADLGLWGACGGSDVPVSG
jgi:micrococcal nuclease